MTTALISTLTVAIGLAVTPSGQEPATRNASSCRVVGKLVALRELPEASGVAASRRSPGWFWAHNDSGDPVIFALDSQGVVKNRVRVKGAAVDDWEDIAVAPCAAGSCLYIADIGDNNGARKSITVYRVVEPAPTDSATSGVETFQAAYPDGPHDAEALFVSGESEIFIITKGDPGRVALYRFPRSSAPGATGRLERVAEMPAGRKIEARDRPTAAAVSPNAQWVAVRTTQWVGFYRTNDLIAGRWQEVFRYDLDGLGEPQGEGITFADNETLVLVGEAGGPLRGEGSFARLQCTFGGK
jgi:hypothetical protein